MCKPRHLANSLAIFIASISFALLTACGGQSGIESAASNTSSSAASAAAQNQSVQSSSLLSSLALLYPNGQLPASNVTQAAYELAQNPAAVKLTAETSQAASATSNHIFQAQAVAADYKPVTRIQNTTLTGAYFFTIYDTERTDALASNPNWRLEGPAFWASLAPDAALNPVHRFRNVLNGSYLYTIYDGEKLEIIANYSNTFVYEGVAWYAKQTPGIGWSPLYRFRNLLNGTYLFSAYESEKNAIVSDYSAIFMLEGVAYYVRQDAPVDAVACAAAPIASTGYSLVFKSCNANNVATYYDKTECVRDNTTGLLWQGQTPAGTGLRANDLLKTNYDSSTTLQKWSGTGTVYLAPTQSEIDASTNAVGFRNAVNAEKLCGSAAWRLPTQSELLGIVKTNESPTIDNAWFPNTLQNGWYWTSSPYTNNTNNTNNTSTAWLVGFSNGFVSYGSRIYGFSVRLVQ